MSVMVRGSLRIAPNSAAQETETRACTLPCLKIGLLMTKDVVDGGGGVGDGGVGDDDDDDGCGGRGGNLREALPGEESSRGVPRTDVHLVVPSVFH